MSTDGDRIFVWASRREMDRGDWSIFFDEQWVFKRPPVSGVGGIFRGSLKDLLDLDRVVIHLLSVLVNSKFL